MKLFACAFAAAAIIFAGCSGGGAAASPTPGPTPTQAAASDQDRTYARVVCSAFEKYLASFNEATRKDPQLFSDQKKMLRTAAPILDTFSKDLAKAKPAKDMANFHDALVERVKTFATKAKAGLVITNQEIQQLSRGAPLPPATVRHRLEEASSNVPQCQRSGGMDALFGDTGATPAP